MWAFITITTILTAVSIPQGTAVSVHVSDVTISQHFNTKEECIAYQKTHPGSHTIKLGEPGITTTCVKEP